MNPRFLAQKRNSAIASAKQTEFCKKLCIAIFFLLISGTGKVWAADEEYIAVQSDVSHSFSFIPDSDLITAAALEKPLTQRYIAQYTAGSGIEYLNAALERGSVYLPFIKEEIEKRSLPPEFLWLPLIESSFHITARSRSGAVGLWQFMLNSISGYGISVNDIIDERRDFIKSTKGALQKLEDNYKTLGNWELALAAYNAGLGAVTRTIKRTNIKDYWLLSEKGEFKQETEHYVPKLIAAAYVLSQPEKYNINIRQDSFEWTIVSLPRQVSLDIVAEEAGMERELLRKLNAQMLHGISPAVNEYPLIVPSEHLESIISVLQREDLQLLKYHYHTVHQGDTLWAMSMHYGTSLEMIEQHNQGILNRYLKIGETVVIPAYKEVSPPPSRAVLNQQYNGNHVVEKGETLWSLGKKYGVDAEALATANNMSIDQILREGRSLKVPIIDQ